MRFAPNRRRRWNNMLILGVLLFMVVLNLPTIIKTYLIDTEESPYPYLLNPRLELQALHFNSWSLEQNQGRWRVSTPSNISPEELVTRWQSLVGTHVDDKTYSSLSQQLNTMLPQTIEVWYYGQEEPQRVTWYKTPQFWLLKNWQDEWIAVSADERYLIPNN